MRAAGGAAITAPLVAQGISFGVVGGVEPPMLSDNVPTAVRSAFTRTRFVPNFGLQLEYEFTARRVVEAGLLLRRPAFTSTFTYNAAIRQFNSPDAL